MKLELLYIDSCPNTVTTLNHVEAAIATLGRADIPVQLRRIESPADTTDTCFAGSPTIAANGADLFPGATRSNDLACRIYRTPSGLSGTPTIELIIEALKRRGI